MQQVRSRLSYANVIATVALFVALGGGAYALQANSVGTKQLKNGAVTTKKLKGKAVTGKKIKGDAVKSGKVKDGSLKGKDLKDLTLDGAKISDGAVGTAKVADNAIGFDKLSNIKAFYERGNTTASSPDPVTARANATEVPLFSYGPFEVYGKCYEDSDDGQVLAHAFIKTSRNRSLLSSLTAAGTLGGGPVASYLNTDTPEAQRSIGIETAAPPGVGTYFGSTIFFPDGAAISPDGDSLWAMVNRAAKNGALAGGDGPYLPGKSCIWHGHYVGTS